METFEDWIRELTTSQVGRIFWANYQYDLRKNNLDSEVNNNFQISVESRLEDSSSAVELIDAVISDEPNNFDLKCSRRPGKAEAYSRVMEVTDLAVYNLRLDEVGLELDAEVGSRVWDKLGTTITSYYHKDTMKTGRNFFWCLPSKRLSAIETTVEPNQKASAVRNQLGLYHIDKDRRLLRIDIPSDALAGRVIRAPTSLDAGPNVVFVPCDDDNGNGWAINLETLSNSVEELIIEGLSFDSSYTVTKIGIVSEPLPDLNMDILESNALNRS